MAKSPVQPQQGGSSGQPQQPQSQQPQGQQPQGQQTGGAMQQAGQPIFRDWASI